jgi:hypothetical protein
VEVRNKLVYYAHTCFTKQLGVDSWDSVVVSHSGSGGGGGVRGGPGKEDMGSGRPNTSVSAFAEHFQRAREMGLCVEAGSEELHWIKPPNA